MGVITMFLMGKNERFYKAVYMDQNPLGGSGWHRTVWTERSNGKLIMWTTVIKNGTATFHYSHQEKDEAELMLADLMEQIDQLNVPYVVFDFTKKDNLEEQISLLKKHNTDFAKALGCTEDELRASLRWKL